jgi:hypothetical protein
MEVKEAVLHLEGKMAAHSAEMDKKTTEAIQVVQKEFKLKTEAFETEVKELNTKLAAKDATLTDIQNEVKELKAKGNRVPGGITTTGRMNYKMLAALEEVAVAETIKDNPKAFETPGALLREPVKVKTVGSILSSNLTGDNYKTYLDWQPGMEPTGQFRFRSLVRTLSSGTDFVQFPRAATPVGEGSMGRQTEGQTKAQVDRDLSMIDLTLKPMAGYATVSRQALRNIPFLQSYLPMSMMEQLQDAEDLDFANALVAAATGVSTTAGITVAVERMIFFIKNQIQAKFNTTAIVSDANVWAQILVTKPQDYSVPNCVTIDTNGVVRILGRPLYPVNWLTGNRVVVGDWSRAAVVQSEGLTMRQSDSHASTFTSNEITFLLERTEGLAVFRPDAFITTTLT